MITLQELIYDISQIWREDNKASFEQKYFETKTSIEHYTEQLHKPAVGQRSVGTATCGVDDNGWQCQKTTEPGGVASQCMNGCVLAGSSCEGYYTRCYMLWRI